MSKTSVGIFFSLTLFALATGAKAIGDSILSPPAHATDAGKVDSGEGDVHGDRVTVSVMVLGTAILSTAGFVWIVAEERRKIIEEISSLKTQHRVHRKYLRAVATRVGVTDAELVGVEDDVSDG